MASLIRLFALGSYVYQSAASVLIIVLVGHLVSPDVYTAYSLAYAVTQLMAVLAFEWVQIAITRFLSGAAAADRARLRISALAAFCISSLVLAVALPLASYASSIDPELAALSLCLALVQGLTDLQFTVIRLGGRLGLAAALMAVRASGILLGAVLGASLFGTAEAVMAGIALGQAVASVAGLATDGSLLARPRELLAAGHLGAFSRYGLVAAGASVLFLGATLLLRFLMVRELSATSELAAGFSMAFDLLQRPFQVIVAAIHIVSYPEVVDTHDNRSPAEARRAAGRLLEFFLCATLVLLGGLVAFLPDVAWIFVPPAFIAPFLAVAPAASAFAFVNTHIQASAAVVLHLQRRMGRLFLVALGQFAVAPSLAAIGLALGSTVAGALALAAAGTLVWMVVTSGPTIRFRAQPRALLSLASLAGAAAIGASIWMPTYPPGWFLLKVAIAGTVTAAIAWAGDFLRLRDGREAA